MQTDDQHQLGVEVLGIGNNLNPFTQHNSSARGAMHCSHITQALVIEGCTPRRIQTGAEREVGKYTFDISFPVDANIIKMIEVYPRAAGYNNIRHNPRTVIIFEDAETKAIDILNVEKYHCKHTLFGFEYHLTPAASKIYPGQFIPKGTVIAQSKAHDDKGNYNYGIEAQIAFMSIPQVIEDGFVISESFAEKLTTTAVESRQVSWGKHYYPLNLYGDKDNYQPFPEIGQKIRDDGLIMGLRPYDPIMGAVSMTPEFLMEVDDTYDKLTYGTAGATVYDIEVDRDLNLYVPTTPLGMNTATTKYLNAKDTFYANILKEYRRLQGKQGKNLQISGEFDQLIVEALANDPNSVPYKVVRCKRRVPLDDRHITIKYAKKIKPTKGFKITDAGNGA